MELAEKKCQPCSGGVIPLPREKIDALLPELDGWQLADGSRITRTIALDNFKQSLELANRIGAIAEEEGHHPDLLVRWGELSIEIWTHTANGLTESDFILAAKIDRFLKQQNR